MKQPIKVPAVGESITEATISAWLKKDGEFANQGEPVLAIDTDKASVEVVADAAGTVKSMAKPGDVVKIGAVVGEIDTDGKASASAPSPAPAPAAEKTSSNGVHGATEVLSSPAVRRVAAETGADLSKVAGSGPKGRVTKSDVMSASPGGGGVETIVVPVKPVPAAVTRPPKASLGRGSRRVPMTTIRKRIAERLLSAQQNMAILTTFNEVDLSAVNVLREKYKEQFKQKYGIGLGFMGFFTKAAIEALKDFPQVNAFIDGTDIIYNDFFNVGVAVSTEKGLIVPVIKDADTLSLAEIELAIKGYSLKAKEGKISLDDLSGGTFTISNGGVFGSLMSTPILNPPQSAILGMHSIQDRPVVVNGQIVIRPMMYLALSYDHRMIDGKEAVSFLVKIKEAINDPTRLLLEV